MDTADELTEAVKALALAAGFARAGVAAASPAARGPLDKWLAAGYHGQMRYMARHTAERHDPARLVPGARSVLCLAVGYAPATDATRRQAAGPALLARFARGADYHRVLKKRCLRLMDRIRRIAPHFDGRAFVDTGPVMERRLAALAGVGWIGRNGCLICPALGSYVLLCEIICNLPLRPDAPLDSQCRGCDACMAACPTGAFVAPGLIDARRCISYLTIEHRGPIPPDLRERMGRRVLGCDACQAACPHNRDLPAGDAELRRQGSALGAAGLADILAWRPADWDAATRGSAARRATHEMFVRNAVIAAGNSSDASLRAPLRRLRRGRPEWDELISWALGRLEGA